MMGFSASPEQQDTIEELCASVGIEATYQGRREHENGWAYDAWTVDLTYDSRKIRGCRYNMGTGHSPPWLVEDKKRANYGQHPRNWKATPPRAVEVIDSLLIDVTDLAGGFEAWAASYGYDSDSRKTEAIYRQCLETLPKLRALLGPDFDRFEQAERL